MMNVIVVLALFVVILFIWFRKTEAFRFYSQYYEPEDAKRIDLEEAGCDCGFSEEPDYACNTGMQDEYPGYYLGNYV